MSGILHTIELMIKWCSYCQRVLAESEPFEVFEYSHGICRRCFDNKKYTLPYEKDVKGLLKFFEKVKKMGCSRGVDLAPAVLKEAQNLGIRPLDLLIGIIQPSLVQIGVLWEQGEISVEDEHQFTAFASRVIDLCEQPSMYRQAKEPDFLILAAPGNYHVLGVKVIEQLLISYRKPTYCVFPGIPVEEVEALVIRLKPKFVGISFSTLEQAQLLPHLLDILSEVEVFIGGAALRRTSWRNLERRNVTYFNEFSKLERLCQRG